MFFRNTLSFLVIGVILLNQSDFVKISSHRLGRTLAANLLITPVITEIILLLINLGFSLLFALGLVAFRKQGGADDGCIDSKLLCLSNWVNFMTLYNCYLPVLS